MSHGFRVVLPILAATITGCALYDTERGVLVSSTAQMINVSLLPSVERPIQLLAFNTATVNIEGKETRGVLFVPMVTYTYRFDDVDQDNLRKSVLESLRGGDDLGVIDVPPQADPTGLQGTIVRVEMGEVTVDPGGINTCSLDSVVHVTRRVGARSTPLRVEGTSVFSIASAKNDAIKKYVTRLTEIVNQP